MFWRCECASTLNKLYAKKKRTDKYVWCYVCACVCVWIELLSVLNWTLDTRHKYGYITVSMHILWRQLHVIRTLPIWVRTGWFFCFRRRHEMYIRSHPSLAGRRLLFITAHVSCRNNGAKICSGDMQTLRIIDPCVRQRRMTRCSPLCTVHVYVCVRL